MTRLRVGAFVAVVTVAIVGMLAWSAEAFGLHGPVFAFLLIWLPLAWLATVGSVWKFSLPDGWYSVHPFEADGTAYERLGVRVAKRLLRRGPLSALSRAMRLPPNPTPADLATLAQQMVDAETSHVIAFAVGGFATVGLGVAGYWDTAGWALLFDCMINVYPVMLQRYNRVRLSAHQRRRTDAGP